VVPLHYLEEQLYYYLAAVAVVLSQQLLVMQVQPAVLVLVALYQVVE
jgi:hypothetical protein